MSIMLCPNADELKQFSLGLLAEPHSDQLATHLSQCQDCQAELETVVDDSLVADLRAGDPQNDWQDDVAKSLGAFAENSDLTTLVAHAVPKVIAEDQLPTTLIRTTTPPPFWALRIPVWTTVTMAFASLIVGFLLGVIITIKYPDGTKVSLNLPKGSEVRVDHADTPDNDVTGNVTSQQDRIEYSRDELADMPLALVVLTDGQAHSSELQQELAALQQAYDVMGPVPTRTAMSTYIALYSGVINRETYFVGLNGATYLRAESEPSARIGWEAARGHLSAKYDGRGRLTLQLDDDFKDRIAALPSRFVNRRLAIVSFGRVVAVEEASSLELVQELTISVDPFASGDRSVFDVGRMKRLFKCIAEANKDVSSPPPAFSDDKGFYPALKHDLLDSPLALAVVVAEGADASQRLMWVDERSVLSVNADPTTQILAQEMRGHVSDSLTSKLLTVKFDESLAARVNDFCKQYQGSTLAVISFGQVVALAKPGFAGPKQLLIDTTLMKSENLRKLLGYIRNKPLIFSMKLPDILATADLAVCVVANEEDIREGRSKAVQSLRNALPEDPEYLKPHATEIGVYLPILPTNLVKQQPAVAFGVAWVMLESQSGATFTWDLAEHVVSDLNGDKLRLTINPRMLNKLENGFTKYWVGRQIALVSRGKILSTHDVTSTTALRDLTIDTSALSEQEVEQLILRLSRHAESPSPATSDRTPTLQGVWLLKSKVGGGSKKSVYPTLASFVGNTYAMMAANDVIDSGTFDYDGKSRSIGLRKHDQRGTELVDAAFPNASTMELHTIEQGQPTVRTFRRIDVAIDELQSLELDSMETAGKGDVHAVSAAKRALKLLENDASTNASNETN